MITVEIKRIFIIGNQINELYNFNQQGQDTYFIKRDMKFYLRNKLERKHMFYSNKPVDLEFCPKYLISAI